MLCNFCGGETESIRRIKAYKFCSMCGTWTRNTGDHQTLMINEKLGLPIVPDKLSAKLLQNVLQFKSESDSGLVDFGCGGGKFLLAATPYIPKLAGVEITPSSIEAAKSQGLEIVQEFPLRGFTMATFWHSLEHLPFRTLKHTLECLKLSEVKTVFISVPNSNSLTLRFCGEYDAYYDEQNHTFIFSKETLCELLQQIGFVPINVPRNWHYTLFGVLQSSINFNTRTKNEIYMVLKRGESLRSLHLIRHLIMIPAIVPFAVFLFLLSFLRKENDPVVNLVFVRRE